MICKTTRTNYISKIILFFLVLYSSVSNAQEYFPLVDTASVWMEAYSYNGAGYPEGEIEQYYISGDTIVNGTEYKKLHYSTQNFYYFGDLFEIGVNYSNIYYHNYPRHLIRENIEEKKVYYLAYTPYDSTEILLYDFSLNVGDTLTYGMQWQLNFVYDIDSVLIGSSYRKRFQIASFEEPIYPYVSVIEGIGSTFGLIAAIVTPFETGEYLICFTNDGETTVNFGDGVGIDVPHPADSTSHCTFYEPTTVNSILKQQNINLFPNPVSDVLYIEIPSNITKGQIKIYNSTNQLQSEYFCNPCGSNSLSIDEFTPGIYYLVFTNENESYLGKFVKL